MEIKIKVVDAAKAHIGKTLTVEAHMLRTVTNNIDGTSYTLAMGYTDYNGKGYNVSIYERQLSSGPHVQVFMEAFRSRITLDTVVIL